MAIASEEEILRKTDLFVEKARIIVSFFNSLRLLVIKVRIGVALFSCRGVGLIVKFRFIKK